jgi:hypothetical protein
MNKHGTITPFTAFGYETGEMYVRGNNNQIFHYNQVKNCLLCGGAIAIDR